MGTTNSTVLAVGTALTLFGLLFTLRDGIDSLPEVMQLVGLLLILGVTLRVIIVSKRRG